MKCITAVIGAVVEINGQPGYWEIDRFVTLDDGRQAVVFTRFGERGRRDQRTQPPADQGASA